MGKIITFEKICFSIAAPNHSSVYIIWYTAESIRNSLWSIDKSAIFKLPIKISLKIK